MTTRKSTEEKEAYVKVYDLDRIADQVGGLRADFQELQKSIEKRDSEYVTKKDLELRVSKADQVVKFFWWVAGAVGLLVIGTMYQVAINAIRLG